MVPYIIGMLIKLWKKVQFVRGMLINLWKRVWYVRVHRTIKLMVMCLTSVLNTYHFYSHFSPTSWSSKTVVSWGEYLLKLLLEGLQYKISRRVLVTDCYDITWSLKKNSVKSESSELLHIFSKLLFQYFLACRSRQASIVLERYFRFEMSLLSILCMLIAQMEMRTSRVPSDFDIIT